MVLSKDMKIAICFGLIIGALISICNICFAAETIELSPTSVKNSLYIKTSTSSIESNVEAYHICNYKLLTLGDYVVINNYSSTNIWVGLCKSSDPSLNDEVFDIHTISGGGSYGFYVNDYQYQYLVVSLSNATDNFSVTYSAQGLTGFVGSIAYYLSVNDLSQVWNIVVPILAISVLLALGFYLLKRLLNKIKRAKGGA